MIFDALVSLALNAEPVTDSQRTPTSASVSANADREWATTRPARGMVGRYQDSNVYRVWHDASHRERSTWLCIRRHESMSYSGDNPGSTASGAGQWLRSTWAGLSHWVKVDGVYVARRYREAKDAPAWVQDAAFRHVWNRGDLSMWKGTHCAPGMGAT